MVGKDYLDDRRKELGPIQDKFFDLQEYFWKKEIALNQSSIDAVQGFITSSIEILSNLQASNYSANMEDGSTSYRQWGAAYEIMQNKLTLAKKELVLDFRRVMQS